MTAPEKPLRIPDLAARKKTGEKISMLTVYDATMAALFDKAGIDTLLVGDSLGMVIQGASNTLGVTMDAMIHHTKAVRAGTKRAVVIGDMPFLSYQVSSEDALRNAGRLVQEGGAQCVKLEGGTQVAGAIERIVKAGIPVMGHIGMTPQSVNTIGGFRRVGKNDADRKRILEDAKAVAAAGAFSMVLEFIPHDLAKEVTESVPVPTIGVGAGPHCDGQGLVGYDALGLYDEFIPSFAKQYVNLRESILKGTAAFIEEIRSGKYEG